MTRVGFDFGTTNSLISMIDGDKAINFLDNGMPYPSMVCYEGGKVIVGREARQRLARAGLGVQGNVVRSPKRLLGRENVSIDDIKRNPVDIVADVVSYIRTTVTQNNKLKNRALVIDNAVVTIPVDMKGYQRAALRDAFRKAGIGIFQFIHEPLAALYGHLRSNENYAAKLRQYDRQLILVFDWGGGTLDLTLCRLINGNLFQITNDGTDEVGGDVFDEQLRNAIVKRVMAARGLNEDVMIEHNAKMRLLHDCERAKIDLSTKDKTSIFVSNFFKGLDDPDLDYLLTRDELETLVGPLLDKGLHRIERLLQNADVLPMGLALCLVTGGMSNMPAIKARLHQLFGPQRVQVSERNATLIAEGAAWAAYDQARLILAKNVELQLARNSRIPLIKAGLLMPREGEIQKIDFHLYCVDPRDGFAKFQFESPVNPGPQVLNNDLRVPLDNLTVKVDAKAKPFHERLELELQIDDNLILQAQARSLNQKDLAKTQVHMLEFGLILPGNPPNKGSKSESFNVSQPSSVHEKGSLALRSNISSEKNEALIPGELLYQINPGCFDVRRNPSPIQDQERLYYEPCSVCRRPSNDPLCRCASTAPRTQIGMAK